MADLSRIIGSSPYGVSSYLQSMLAYYTAILIQQGRGLADSEGNAIGSLLTHQAERTWAGLGGAGLLARCTPGASGVANVARLHAGANGVQALIGGQLAELRGATDGTTIDVTLAAPPESGTRTDLIYLEAWLEEIQPTISPESASNEVYKRGNTHNATPLANDLVVVASTETARRLQLRYALKAAAGAATPAGLALGGYTYSAGPVVGEYTVGDGTHNAGAALASADGERRAIVLATVARSVGVTTIAAGDIDATAARLVLLGVNADRLDLYHASSTPTANTLLPLDGSGKFPSSVFSGLAGSATDVDLVDGFHASSTPTANTLLPLDGSATYPNSVLKTGSGQGIDADQVDGYHAAVSPTASRLLPLDGSAKYPNSVLKTGSGQGIDADQVDGRHASLTPTANTLLALDGSGKLTTAALYTGSGQGLDADQVDGSHASTTPAASRLLALDGAGQYPNSAIRTGSGQGLDVDLLDGQQAAAFAAASHAAGVTMIAQHTNNGIYAVPAFFSTSLITESYHFPAGKNISIDAWYAVRLLSGESGGLISVYLYLAERDPANNAVLTNQALQSDGGETAFQKITRTLCIAGRFDLSNPANHFHLYGMVTTTANTVLNYSGMSIFGWYI
jgi:hypothetical protein